MSEQGKINHNVLVDDDEEMKTIQNFSFALAPGQDYIVGILQPRAIVKLLYAGLATSQSTKLIYRGDPPVIKMRLHTNTRHPMYQVHSPHAASLPEADKIDFMVTHFVSIS